MTREVPKCPFYYHQLYCHTQCVSDMVHSPPSCAQGACSDLLILLTLQKSVRCSELNKEDWILYARALTNVSVPLQELLGVGSLDLWLELTGALWEGKASSIKTISIALANLLFAFPSINQQALVIIIIRQLRPKLTKVSSDTWYGLADFISTSQKKQPTFCRHHTWNWAGFTGTL